MTYLAGKIVLDVQAGAPNNGRGEDNRGVVKSFYKGGARYPYISAQAVRRWWRDSLPAEEAVSPVIRSGSGRNQKQQAYTQGRPDQYIDDDLFGYMVAISKENKQRDTVVATGTFVSVVPRQIVSDFGTMTRGFGSGDDPVIHEHEFYSGEMVGDLLIDVPRIGTFPTAGSTKPALLPADEKAVRDAGTEDSEFRGHPALRLPLAERKRRLSVALRSLSTLSGGAKKSLNYGDRTPAMILLAPMKGGVNPFTRLWTVSDQKCVFDVGNFIEELEAWRDELTGAVRIGWAPGFLGDQRQDAQEQLKPHLDDGTVTIGHPRTILAGLADDVDRGELDAWFEDPRG